MSPKKSPSTTREVEAKFRVHPPFDLPALDGERTGAASVDQAREQQLRAVYWDTSDLRLAREGVTLRHRFGEGPGKDERITEARAGLASSVSILPSTRQIWHT